ncbi:unnamed protein product, partial [Rotaria sp. Silwood1]
EQCVHAARIAINAGNEASKSESEQQLSTDNEDEKPSQSSIHKQDQVE